MTKSSMYPFGAALLVNVLLGMFTGGLKVERWRVYEISAGGESMHPLSVLCVYDIV